MLYDRTRSVKQQLIFPYQSNMSVIFKLKFTLHHKVIKNCQIKNQQKSNCRLASAWDGKNYRKKLAALAYHALSDI